MNVSQLIEVLKGYDPNEKALAVEGGSYAEVNQVYLYEGKGVCIEHNYLEAIETRGTELKK